MKQTIEIEVPEGKKAVWKDGKIIFEDIKSQLPETWEEFCKMKNINKYESYIELNSQCDELGEVSDGMERNPHGDRNILPSEKAAEQHLALMQLHQLRDCYRQGWVPDCEKDDNKYCIFISFNILKIDSFNAFSHFLSFQSKEIAEEFLNNFRDLIEQAGDLI